MLRAFANTCRAGSALPAAAESRIGIASFNSPLYTQMTNVAGGARGRAWWLTGTT